MTIKTVESAILDRLNGFIKDLAVEAYPDNPDEYVLLHAQGAVLVHFEGGNPGQPERRGPMVQREDLYFGITVLAKNLVKTDTGAYAVIDDIKKALLGYQIDDCGKIYLRATNLVQIKNGVWEYSVGIAVPTIIVVNQEQA